MISRNQGDFLHRVCAANRAISARFTGSSFIARARPPFGPPALLRATALAGTVKLVESRLGRSRVGRVNGRDEDASRPDLRWPSLPC